MNIFPFVVYKMSMYVLILTIKLVWGKYYKYIFTYFKLIVFFSILRIEFDNTPRSN